MLERLKVFAQTIQQKYAEDIIVTECTHGNNVLPNGMKLRECVTKGSLIAKVDLKALK